METYDVVIAGGGVIGSACAFWLTRSSGLRVLVVEPDPSYARAATALSVASIRQQFSTAVNIRLSQFGLTFIRDIADWLGPAGEIADLGLREQGYLFLAGTQDQADNMQYNNALQSDLQADIELLEPAAIARRWPWLEVADVRLGSFGRRGEGWFDNMGLLWGLRRAARGGARARRAPGVGRIRGRRCADRRGGNARGAGGCHGRCGYTRRASETHGFRHRCAACPAAWNRARRAASGRSHRVLPAARRVALDLCDGARAGRALRPG